MRHYWYMATRRNAIIAAALVVFSLVGLTWFLTRQGLDGGEVGLDPRHVRLDLFGYRQGGTGVADLATLADHRRPAHDPFRRMIVNALAHYSRHVIVPPGETIRNHGKRAFQIGDSGNCIGNSAHFQLQPEVEPQPSQT
jgi:hypothetical protein